MAELSPDLEATEGGILLTPHFLDPVPPGAELTEGHLLTVGVYNLGFCAVDRRAFGVPRLVVGPPRARVPLGPAVRAVRRPEVVRHRVGDLPGRRVAAPRLQRERGQPPRAADRPRRRWLWDRGSRGPAAALPLPRLRHLRPEELSTRLATSTAHLRTEGTAIDRLCREYADALIAHEEALPAAAPYPYWTDTRGRRVSRQLRRAWRIEERRTSDQLPSPFLPEEAAAYDSWRRRALKTEARELVGDAVKSARLALPEEYGRLRNRFPRLVGKLRGSRHQRRRHLAVADSAEVAASKNAESAEAAVTKTPSRQKLLSQRRRVGRNCRTFCRLGAEACTRSPRRRRASRATSCKMRSHSRARPKTSSLVKGRISQSWFSARSVRRRSSCAFCSGELCHSAPSYSTARSSSTLARSNRATSTPPTHTST